VIAALYLKKGERNMPSTLVKNVLMKGKYNNYLVGGNICNAFALGDLGSTDDFFLIGAEPFDESNYPLLTGNILDSEGNILFRLVRNMLVINPGHCSKILGDHVGYEIHDGNGQLIFKVATQFEKLPNIDEECFVTTISANFFNKTGHLVFKAHSGDENERIESSVKSAFGFSGGFGLVQGLNQDETNVARAMLSTGGAIHKVLTGNITDTEVSLDGAALLNAQIDNCTINVSTGEFVLLGQNNSFSNSQFSFSGAAENIRQLVLQLNKSEPEI
jgi:hypothetical protein